MKRVGEILPLLCSDIGIEDAITLKLLRKSWNDIFNNPLNKHTFPKDLKEGTLFVLVNSHLWLTQLRLLKDEFLKELQSYGIKNIEFRFGRIFRKQKENKEIDYATKLSSQQQEWINDIVKRIKDIEVRIAMESLIRKYLLSNREINRKD
ncbi:MAG: DUF721 domain-containing protein [Thermodesulfovibrio sp.]|nr:DUF721 domain-containing protein [Thermodesulfovibrio sp.]MDW7997862.1 DUF721 domain-containing protein [Thermodesulfovibrio sp.]